MSNLFVKYCVKYPALADSSLLKQTLNTYQSYSHTNCTRRNHRMTSFFCSLNRPGDILQKDIYAKNGQQADDTKGKHETLQKGINTVCQAVSIFFS